MGVRGTHLGLGAGEKKVCTAMEAASRAEEREARGRQALKKAVSPTE